MPKPTISDTVLVRLPLFIYNQSVGKLLNKQTSEHVAWEAAGGEIEINPEGDSDAALLAAIPPNAEGETRRRKLKTRS